MADGARQMFDTKTTSGIVLRVSANGKYIVIARDGLKTNDRWASIFWKKE
jgi:hypothetical protein